VIIKSGGMRERQEKMRTGENIYIYLKEEKKQECKKKRKRRVAPEGGRERARARE